MNSYKVLEMKGYDELLDPYRPLIYATFLKSLRFGNEWFKTIDSDTYYKVYHGLMENLLRRSNSEVRLAVLADDLDTCLGWSLSENKTLHYIFVKNNSRDEPSFRRLGIGTALLPPEFDQVSHMTKLGKIIWTKNHRDVKFNPFQ